MVHPMTNWNTKDKLEYSTSMPLIQKKNTKEKSWPFL